jgi:putative phage-type endonuclease
MIILDCDQGSDEWHQARAGVVTASEMKKIHTSTGKASTQADVYMKTLLAEWLIGGPVESYSSQWMERGKEMEEEARSAYDFEADADVVPVGFVYADDRQLMGASPDGLVGDDGLVEFKCPKASTQISYLMVGAVPSEYAIQIQGQMLVTDRKWCDFVSYFPGLSSVTIRVARDERLIMGLRAAVESFVAQMLEKRQQLIGLGHVPAGGE